MSKVSELFARQDGLATIPQLRVLEVGEKRIRQRIASGEWERIDERVIGVASTPVTWRRQVWAALLSAGDDAAVSHSTAARVHGLDGFAADDHLHVTTFDRRHHTALSGVTLHRSKVLRRDQCTTVDGLVCVSRPIALMQIAMTHGREAAGQALDGMLRNQNNPVWISQVATAWRRRGLTGPAMVLDLLHERVDARLPRSWFQRLAKDVLQSCGEAMVDEHPVLGPTGRRLAELDLAIPHLQIGIECQSWRWHATPTAQQNDARRKRALRLLGWEIVDVWWSDLERIDEIAEELAYLIERRLIANLPVTAPNGAG